MNVRLTSRGNIVTKRTPIGRQPLLTTSSGQGFVRMTPNDANRPLRPLSRRVPFITLRLVWGGSRGRGIAKLRVMW